MLISVHTLLNPDPQVWDLFFSDVEMEENDTKAAEFDKMVEKGED